MLKIVLGNIQIPQLCKKFKCHDYFQSAQKCLGIKKKIPTFLRCLKLVNNVNIPKMPIFLSIWTFRKRQKYLGNKKCFSTVVYLEVEFKFPNCPIFLKHIWKIHQIFLKIRIFKISKFGSKMEKVQPI